MKKIVVLAIVALMSAGAYANAPSVTEKVLKAFRETFSDAQNVSWHEANDQYSVRFFQSDVRYIVYYNKNGRITASMRFYDPSLLPMNILSEIKRTYPDKKAFGVTEITSGDNTAYFIKVEDSKHWHTIKADAYGNSEIYETLRKQK
ncbi:hypothetical protein [Agriterribacter sp.]|uniref:hypothetical protein n=1 Tax=Agriterribacter sp. TaxID=2821509 RepID=UPI002C047671|nr:hypothetical protein [Agriterribacter sp.]HTN07036.1 hypothetical protein [Agriterribacter sp.]